MRQLSVSVVIPIRDEERNIRKLLGSLFAQTRPPEEVVMVDGGSKDRTRNIIQDYIAQGYPIRLICTDHAYPGQARNIGIQHVRHEVIAFTDAGIQLHPQWLEKLCEPMEENSGVDVVYGTYEPVTDTFFKECAALAYVSEPTLRDGVWIRGPSIASSLMYKRVWEAVGGFPPYRASEDLIFMEAVERNGFKIAYAPEAIIYWEMAPGWRSTFRRFAIYSYHNLLAGRGRYWHRGVVRQYLIALPFLVLGLVHYPWWCLLPITGFTARIGRTLWRKRRGFAISTPLYPLRWVMVALILLLLDAATFAGTAAWTCCRLYSLLKGQRASVK